MALQLLTQKLIVKILRGHHTRYPEAKDRRVINISLTGHGKAVLKECRGIMKQTMRNKLSRLTTAELADLSITLEKLKDIGTKLE